MKEIISKFENENQFLSNFYPCQIKVNGETYTSAEAAFQAAKCQNAEDRKKYQTCSPAEAKQLGRTEQLPENWDEKSIMVMCNVVRAKFSQNADLREKLLATGSAELVEGNSWHDNKWGACSCKRCADKAKKNVLGKILMDTRKALASDPASTSTIKTNIKKETITMSNTKEYTAQMFKTLEYQKNFVLKLIDGSINWDLQKVAKLRPLAEEDSYFNKDLQRFKKNAESKAALKLIVEYAVSPYIDEPEDIMRRPIFKNELDKSDAYTIATQIAYIKTTLNKSIKVMQDLQLIIESAASEFVALDNEILKNDD